MCISPLRACCSSFYCLVCFAGQHPRDHERPADVFEASGEVSAGQPLPRRRGSVELPRGRGCGPRTHGLPHGETDTAPDTLGVRLFLCFLCVDVEHRFDLQCFALSHNNVLFQ